MSESRSGYMPDLDPFAQQLETDRKLTLGAIQKHEAKLQGDHVHMATRVLIDMEWAFDGLTLFKNLFEGRNAGGLNRFGAKATDQDRQRYAESFIDTIRNGTKVIKNLFLEELGVGNLPNVSSIKELETIMPDVSSLTEGRVYMGDIITAVDSIIPDLMKDYIECYIANRPDLSEDSKNRLRALLTTTRT